MPRNPTLVPRAILPSVASTGGWSHHPPPSPPAVSARNWTKYNKSLKDPVRGAGFAQVQIQSYHNRQSGNLAWKVRNAFLVLMALKDDLVSCIAASTPNIWPPHSCWVPVASWMSELTMEIILQAVSPISIGCTPGHLSNAIRWQASSGAKGGCGVHERWANSFCHRSMWCTKVIRCFLWLVEST